MDDKARETSLWKWLRDGTRDMRPRLHMERIENGVGVGTPDVQGFLGQQFWIELKSCPRSSNIKVKVDVDQARWHRNRFRAGGMSWFLIQVGSGHDAQRFLIPGYRADLFLDSVAIETLEALTVLPPDTSPRNVLNHIGI